jgi:hypothetical protein
VAASPSLLLEAADGPRRLTVDLARRVLSVAGPDQRLEAIELGLLQTGAKWASITGIVRDSRRDQELPFVRIVDDSTGEATLDVAGAELLRATLQRRSP